MGWIRIKFSDGSPPTKAMQELNLDADNQAPAPRGISDAKLAVQEIESGGSRYNYHKDNL